MRLIRSFFLTFIVAGILSANVAKAQTSPIQLLIGKAHSLEGRGRYDLAAQTWRQILIVDPGDTEALAGLARYAKRTGKTDEAQHYLDQLRRIDPRNPALAEIESIGPSLDEHSRLDEAARLAANHQFAEAVRVYRQVFGDNPPPGAWAIAYYETEASLPGGWEKATAALQQLSEQYPAVQEYKLSLGRLLTYRPASRLAGVRLLEQQSALTESARLALRQALVWEKENPAFIPAIQAYLARYHDSELQSIQQSLDAQVRRAEAGVATPQQREQQQGYAQLKAGELEAAERKFDAALQIDPNSVEALSGMGFIRLKQQDFAGALPYFEKAKQLSPHNKTVADGLQTASFWNLMKKGTAALDQNDLEGAISNFKSAHAERPNSVDASAALAGALMKAERFSEAVPLYGHLTQLEPGNADDWRLLVTAKFQAGGAPDALAALRNIPASVSLKLRHNLDFVALTATIYSTAGQDDSAAAAFRDLQRLLKSYSGEVPEDLRVEIAGLCLHLGKAEEAAQSMSKLVDEDSKNIGAWQVLLAALVQNHQENQAAEKLEQIPQQVYDAALSRPSFVRSVAAVDIAAGKLNEAEQMLVKLADSESAGNSLDTPTKLQLANLYAKQGEREKAERLFSELCESNPENADVWKGYMALLHDNHRDAEVIAVRQRMPRELARKLSSDNQYIIVLAAAENATGNRDAAYRLIQDAIAVDKSKGEMAPLDLQLQLSWLLLDSPDRKNELFSLLQQLERREDLTPAESRQLGDIWATWILRAAQSASTSGDTPRALALLERGCRMLPNDNRLKGSLAGLFLKAGDTKHALNVYKNWGLEDASASDYAGAIGAAMTERDKTYSNAWLRQALAKWPRNSQLLDLAGKQAAAQGDYKKAKLYWQDALAAAPSTDSSSDSLADISPAIHDTSNGMRALLVGRDARPDQAGAARDVIQSPTDFARNFTEKSLYGGGEVSIPASAADVAPSLPGVAGNPASFKNNLTQSNSQPSETDSIRDQLSAIDGRNSPYMGTGDSVQGRSGQPGLDRMVIEQAEMEASATLGGQVRVSVAAKPTFVESGTGIPQGDFLFGKQLSGSVVGMQTASGLAADGQISAEQFGAHFGTTPQGFLVKNLIGGIRFTPGNGPITLLFDRDSVQDTLLSFAGTRDPQTGTVWGGVIATSGSVRGNWGNDHSGFYVGIGYQVLTGQNVERNTRIDGNIGSYLKVLSRKEGSLTIGMNISAMHYDKNLRYFSLGQGGYFSPQQYFLFNVPFRWAGNYKQRLQYLLSASLGSQHFEEDASPYYPTQLLPGSYYPGMSSTGANYNAEGKLAYQIAPNWYLGAWANANNARNYTYQSAGVFIRYSFEPRALTLDNYVPSVPDWKGQQPFQPF